MSFPILTPLLFGLATSALLAQQPAQKAGSPIVVDVAPRLGTRCQASQLIGCRIDNATGESLGEIHDIVLDGRNERIAYAVVAFGRAVGVDGKLFAMPWRLIDVGPRATDDTTRATLGLAKATLQAAPGFDPTSWPDMADPTWARQVDDYYRLRGETARPDGTAEPKGSGPDGKAGTAQGPSSEAFGHRRLSRLIGMTVVDSRRHQLGEVEDLVVDSESATVDGALISFGGALATGEQFVLLPAAAMTLDREEGEFVLPCSRADFEAMALPDGKMPALGDDAWLDRGLELCAKARAAELLAAGDGIVAGAAGAKPAPFADAYDPSTIETVTATILTVGSVWIGDPQEERVRLRMRSADGRDRIVHAAPNGFASQQALGLRSGRVIEVTGSPAQHGNQSVLVAGSIAVEGMTATLRDAKGRALWAKH